MPNYVMIKYRLWTDLRRRLDLTIIEFREIRLQKAHQLIQVDLPIVIRVEFVETLSELRVATAHFGA